jgi:hypothetical protein
MPPAFAGLYLIPDVNPQLALWATVIAARFAG